MLTAIDVSGYQPRDISPLIHQYNPDVVRVKLYLPDEHITPYHTVVQSEYVLRERRGLEGYVVCYAALNPTYTIDTAVNLMQYVGATFLWLDIEPYLGVCPDREWVREAVKRCEELIPRQYGIYTGKWVWSYYLLNTTLFSHLPLWNAQYGPPEDPFLPYGGWRKEQSRQWADIPIDQNIIFEEEMTPEQKEKLIKALNTLWDIRMGFENGSSYVPEFHWISTRMFQAIVDAKEAVGLQ